MRIKCTFLFEIPRALHEESRSRAAKHQEKCEQSSEVITCHPFVLSVHRKTRTIGRPPASLTPARLFGLLAGGETCFFVVV